MTNKNSEVLIESARHLLSDRLHGILATHSIECRGYPFGSLVPYTLDSKGRPLMLLSHLARHTQNLDADPRCSLIIIEAGDGNTQQLMRLTCLGEVEKADNIDNTLAENHFRTFPQSRDYYEKLNFHFYRLQPVRFYCVGGFGAARWIDVERFTG